MRAVASSSPSVKHLPPDTPVRICTIRPHAHVAAGVSLFVRRLDLDGPDQLEDVPTETTSARRRRPPDIRFDLDRNVFRNSDLSEGTILDLGVLRDLRMRSEKTFVVIDAVAMLARRDHSTAEIRRKLTKRGYGGDAITYALNTLQERDVQDDRGFAREFIEQRMRRRPVSRRALQAALARRGVDQDLVADEIDRYLQENPDCFARAAEAAVASMRDRGTISDQTLLRRLMQRGFSVEDAKKFFD